MEGLLAVVLGVGVVAVSPFVPGLRPAAKKAVPARRLLRAGVDSGWRERLRRIRHTSMWRAESADSKGRG